MANRKNPSHKNGKVSRKRLETKDDSARREAARKFAHEFGKKYEKAMRRLAE